MKARENSSFVSFLPHFEFLLDFSLIFVSFLGSQPGMSDTENVELDEGSGQIGDAEMELGDLADRRRSSRRRESSRQQQRKSGLEKLREARQSGKGYRPNVSIGDDKQR